MRTRPSRWRAYTTRSGSRRTESRASWGSRSTSPRTRPSTSSRWVRRTSPGEQPKRRFAKLITRVFITGSADGLGRAAAQALLDEGHQVVVHARNRNRLAAIDDLLD